MEFAHPDWDADGIMAFIQTMKDNSAQMLGALQCLQFIIYHYDCKKKEDA